MTPGSAGNVHCVFDVQENACNLQLMAESLARSVNEVNVFMPDIGEVFVRRLLT